MAQPDVPTQGYTTPQQNGFPLNALGQGRGRTQKHPAYDFTQVVDEPLYDELARLRRTVDFHGSKMTGNMTRTRVGEMIGMKKASAPGNNIYARVRLADEERGKPRVMVMKGSLFWVYTDETRSRRDKSLLSVRRPQKVEADGLFAQGGIFSGTVPADLGDRAPMALIAMTGLRADHNEPNFAVKSLALLTSYYTEVRANYHLSKSAWIDMMRDLTGPELRKLDTYLVGGDSFPPGHFIFAFVVTTEIDAQHSRYHTMLAHGPSETSFFDFLQTLGTARGGNANLVTTRMTESSHRMRGAWILGRSVVQTPRGAVTVRINYDARELK